MTTGYGDDSGINDNETVFRWIPASLVVFDENLRRFRPSAQAFRRGGVNASFLVYLLTDNTPDEVTNEGSQRYLVHLRVGLLRELGLGIVRDPTSGGSGYCEITGRKTRSTLNRLAKCAQWVKGYAPE